MSGKPYCWECGTLREYCDCAASGMEAPSGGETAQTGSTEGDSPVPEGQTPND
jgi:hypothetical protein